VVKRNNREDDKKGVLEGAEEKIKKLWKRVWAFSNVKEWRKWTVISNG